MKRIKKGFTMIELLIVIAVLGILAVAVLSAINPLEQIRRGRDTSSRSDTEQLISALDRYFAAHGRFPWQTAEGEDVNVGTADVPWEACGGAADVSCTAWIADLVDEEELKTGFENRVLADTANPIFLFYNDEQPGASVYGCFAPQSKAFNTEAGDDCINKRASADFPGTDACPALCEDDLGDANVCNICLP